MLVLFTGMVMSSSAMTSSVKLAWDPNTEADLVGYKIYKTTNCFSIFRPTPQDPSPVFVPLYSLKDPDKPVFELHGLENGTTYFFAVTAENASGEESGFSNTVSYTPADINTFQLSTSASQEPPLEFGEVWVDHDWKPVAFVGSYSNPVVVAGPLSSEDPSDAVVRIDRITTTGFEVSVQELDYQDGVHDLETVDYLVMEAGGYTLPEGKRVEAGHVQIDEASDFLFIPFRRSFGDIPVVIASVVSINEEDAVTVRLSDISASGFKLQLQEYAANNKEHVTETISYIAWEPSQGIFSDLSYFVSTVSYVALEPSWEMFYVLSFFLNTIHEGMTAAFMPVSFEDNFSDVPAIIATPQTCYSNTPSILRMDNITSSGVYIRLSEDQSLDRETGPLVEMIGFIGISNADE